MFLHTVHFLDYNFIHLFRFTGTFTQIFSEGLGTKHFGSVVLLEETI